MIVEDIKGETITSLAEWAKLYDTPQSSHQWKRHRSAHSAAEFIMNRSGADLLNARVADAIGEPVAFDRAVPEYEVRFDRFGRGRMHDLAIFGQSGSGRSLFVGVEAKVDEPFGEYVRDAYLKAKAKQISGVRTNAPERMENLLRQHFSHDDPKMFDVRYQLLYATAGTLAAGADISVLFTVVFKTPLYNETASAGNFRDYVDFLEKAGATTARLSTKETHASELTLNGKKLLCLYENIDLRD